MKRVLRTICYYTRVVVFSPLIIFILLVLMPIWAIKCQQAGYYSIKDFYRLLSEQIVETVKSEQRWIKTGSYL